MQGCWFPVDTDVRNSAPGPDQLGAQLEGLRDPDGLDRDGFARPGEVAEILMVPVAELALLNQVEGPDTPLAAGQIVPPFEVLDATHKKVIDGWHAIAYYWVGKSPTAALFAAPPGGPFGMDHMDYLGWLYVGGGLEMWREFYQNDLKLPVTVWPAHPSSPQAFGWFKKPLKSVADFKGVKMRAPEGLSAEIWRRIGDRVLRAGMSRPSTLPDAWYLCVLWVADDAREIEAERR